MPVMPPSGAAERPGRSIYRADSSTSAQPTSDTSQVASTAAHAQSASRQPIKSTDKTGKSSQSAGPKRGNKIGFSKHQQPRKLSIASLATADTADAASQAAATTSRHTTPTTTSSSHQLLTTTPPLLTTLTTTTPTNTSTLTNTESAPSAQSTGDELGLPPSYGHARVGT